MYDGGGFGLHLLKIFNHQDKDCSFFVPPAWSNSDSVSGEVGEWFWRALLFARLHSQSETNIGLLEESLDFIVELFPVLVEMHDALWFFSQPEFIKLVRQIA